MKFNHLNVPESWKHYWTRYPEGYTILEALISWVSQVDSMVDNQNKLNDNVAQFRNEIDAFVERFDDRLQSEVTQTLADWQASGFLDVVISEALQWQLDEYIATNEADKTSLITQMEQNRVEIPIEKFMDQDKPNEIGHAIKRVLEEAEKGTTVFLNPSKNYTMTEHVVIDKPLTINFNSAPVKVEASGVDMFDLLYTNATNFRNRIRLLNCNFTSDYPNNSHAPNSIIRINQAINTVITGSFERTRAVHSVIWNWKGYGTKIDAEFRYNDAPRVIYLSNSATGEEHSFALDIRVDITGSTGKGIEAEGGGGIIKGVIEDCDKGGYEFNGIHNSVGMTLQAHFEANDLFDVKLGNLSTSGPTNQGITTLDNCFFGPSSTVHKILYGNRQGINITNSYGAIVYPSELGAGFGTRIYESGNNGVKVTHYLTEEQVNLIKYNNISSRDMSYIDKLTVKEELVYLNEKVKEIRRLKDWAIAPNTTETLIDDITVFAANTLLMLTQTAGSDYSVFIFNPINATVTKIVEVGLTANLVKNGNSWKLTAPSGMAGYPYYVLYDIGRTINNPL